jgi:cytochrome c biogenesis protein CcmG, thiol:disulfide interchange protein DsbE
MKKIITGLLLLFVVITNAQEKKIWAKSFINKEAPAFVVEEWITDKPDMKGKFVLIDFWATWCGPCKKAIPELNSFRDEFKEDLIVIGISNESKEKVLTQVNPKIDYFSAIDPNKTLNKLYGVKGIPHCVLIDPSGIVRWEGWPQLEGYELTSEVIKEIITKYKQ